MKGLPYLEIFAVEVTRPDSTGQKILKANHPYYLLKGYSIEKDDAVLLSQKELYSSSIYNDYLKRFDSTLNVSVSAIVGANGSGKSTLVEYILRLLNNFSAAFMLDEDMLNKEHHLRYIPDLYGKLWFMSDGKPYLIQVAGTAVSFYEYYPSCDDNTVFIKNARSGCVYTSDVTIEDIQFAAKGNKYRTKKAAIEIARHIFFTYVSNYSLYGYNPKDFRTEWNSSDGTINAKIDERGCWLDGLFHKNDGYQTPIVLTPYRENGNINVNKEKVLSDDRLLTLLLCGKGFDKLNGHLQVVELKFTYKESSYDETYLQKECGLKIQPHAFCSLREHIVVNWKKLYNLSFEESMGEDLKERALDYLACKTIKASYIYRNEYGSYFDKLKDIENNISNDHIDVISELVCALSGDGSHITTKIRQVLVFLVTGTYFRNGRTGLNLNNAISEYSNTVKLIKSLGLSAPDKLCRKPEDYLPPHFLRVNIGLLENNGTKIEFQHLSSGERQLIYSVCSILYHLSNIDSVYLDANEKRIAYNKVLVIMEEIELYFHPKFQQSLLKYLLDGIAQMKFKNLTAVSFMIVTHSPFVLSDISSSNILALENGIPVESSQLKSFGANIHDMLNTGFFLDNCRGSFSEDFIATIIKQMQKDEEAQSASNVNHECCNSIRRKIAIIDEPIIRNALLNKFHDVYEKDNIQWEIDDLETKLNRLKEIRANKDK